MGIVCGSGTLRYRDPGASKRRAPRLSSNQEVRIGDERKVKQVLLNLLSNAVKFTPEGGRITLTAGRRDGTVEISVTDTGIGIAPEDQAAIFEEFRQVGTDETRKQEGTGLGLTLAKKLVELHGGRIWVESGSTALLGRSLTVSTQELRFGKVPDHSAKQRSGGAPQTGLPQEIEGCRRWVSP